MFSKAKKTTDTKASAAATPEAFAEVQARAAKPTRPAAQSMANAPRRAASAKPSGVPSIISGDVELTGSILSSGEVQLDGVLEGDIRAATLIIGEKAAVRGEVVCDNVTVRGTVEGGIRARSVTLSSTSNIMGDIIHSTLQVETGAHFEGNCRHSDDPLSDDAAKEMQATSSRPVLKRPASPAPAPAPAQDEDDETPASLSGHHGLNGAVEPKPFLTGGQGKSPLR